MTWPPTDVVPGEQVSAEFARTFAVTFLTAWNSHDPARVTAVTVPEIRWEDPFIDGGRLDGHQALREWALQAWRAMPDLAFEVDGELHLALDSRSVMAAWTATGRMTGPLSPPGFAPTGTRIDFTGVDTWWFRDGLLLRVCTHTDVMTVARQLGAAPNAGNLRREGRCADAAAVGAAPPEAGGLDRVAP